MRRRRSAGAAAALVAMLLAGGARAIEARILDFDDLNGWASDDHAAAREVFGRTCADAEAGAFGLTADDWAPACAAAAGPGDARAFFQRHFVPVELQDDDGPGLVTGYYEPELLGARAPAGRFRHPLHRPPEADDDAALSRAEIRAGALDGRGLELVWLEDPVEAFFLHVQGSGRIRLRDGSVMRVGYAGRNGHPYRSVGRMLLAEGALPRGQVSAQGIGAWVRRDPKAGLAFLDRNPSYIFFRQVTGLDDDAGPVGAMGEPLTAMRSIAADRSKTPLGAPVWLETRTPEGRLRRLTVAQDTGAAINGAQRADLFFGSGDAAGALAGRMKATGRLVTLIPRAAAARLADGT